MFELWKLEKNVEKYFRLTLKNPKEARENYDLYFQDIIILKELLEVYNNMLTDELFIWCNCIIDISLVEEKNIITKVNKKILMGIAEYYLTKSSKEMEIVSTLQEKMNWVHTRFNQFENFTVYTKRT